MNDTRTTPNPELASSSRRLTLRPWHVVTVLALAYALLVVAINDGDPLALVTIGTRFSEGTAAADGGTEGYDGQFVYYIALDAATADTLIAQGGDVPAYRYQRVLLPALGAALSFGNDDWLPWSLLLVSLVALAAGTATLETLLLRFGVSRWYALAWAGSLAALGTVRLTLPETLAYALALGATLMALQDRWLLAAVLIALAALARETTLLFGAAIGFHLLFVQRRMVIALLFGVVALTPFVLWQFFLYDRLGAIGVGSGGAGATDFTPIPFGGVLAIALEAVRVVFSSIDAGEMGLVEGLLRLTLGLTLFAAILGPLVLAPTLWALQRTWQALRVQNDTSLIVLLLAFNAGVMLFVPFSTYREPLGILRFIAGLQIAIVLYAAQSGHQKALLFSTLWVTTMLFLVGSDLAGGTPGG